MTDLSPDTWAAVRRLFPPEQQAEVAELLRTECGNNLPFQETADAKTLERFQLAALDLSNGTLPGLHEAIDLAKTDWRDLLMATDPDNARHTSPWRTLLRLWPRRRT
jgi:hypothetical protein